MTMSHVDEELLAYRVIDLSELPLLLPTEVEQRSDIFLSFTNGKIHEPVELRGEGDFFSVIFFFVLLRRTTPEICYRQNIESMGRVVFSIYDSYQKLRPRWIETVRELTEEEKETVNRIAEETSIADGKIDIVALWEQVCRQCPEMSTSALVLALDQLVSEEKEIHMEGVIPLVSALAVMNYLLSTRRLVQWNGIPIC